jgi:hypothetical protein
MDEQRVRVFENKVLMTIFGPEIHEITRKWKEHIVRNIIISKLYQILLG